MERGASSDPKVTINPGYVVGQLTRALTAAEYHADPAVRERAAEKVRKWRQVFEGIVEGALTVGSRTPVAGTPAWATLEVAHGGFATGNLMTGGALQPHETELQDRLDASGVAPGRTALNLFYLTDAGREELLRALRSGCYRVNVPEEGALPTVAWLLAHGASDDTQRLLETIAPFFDRLRFFPVPDPRPLGAGTAVRLQPIGKTVEGLRATKQQPRVLAMNEALTVWAPLYDRALALFLETVEGPLPTLRTNETGELLRRPDGHPYVDGGWPCRIYPPGWATRARRLLEDYARTRASHCLSRKPEKKKENFAQLRAYLDRAAGAPSTLTGRDVGMVRRILASFVTRHGEPGSERLTKLRARQAEIASLPTHGSLRAVVLNRLAALSAEDGLQSVDAVAGPVTPGESGALGVRAGSPVPASIVRKLRRSVEAPVAELVEQGVIPSAEILGVVLPQLTSQIRAAGISDPDLRRLYAAVYAAFRRRRSLLLLDLEHQVRLEELPWIAAINAFRRTDTAAEEAARESLRQVSLLSVTSYPQTILPNKFLRELRALASAAKADVPIVDELAADIFTGDFSEKFLRASQIAAQLLSGTLYERYYGIPYDEVLVIADVQKSKYGAPTSPAFATLCTRLAGPETSGRWSVAKNGKIIEQEQILTTHNLAALFASLRLVDAARGELPELARRCFVWVCQQQQRNRADRKSQLHMVKNTAYAWRQMLFFLSVAREPVDEFVRWGGEHFSSQSTSFQARFAPAIRGLRYVVQGGRFDATGASPDGGRRFLGWTTERHWVLGTREDAGAGRA
jgi:hypothetical protein